MKISDPKIPVLCHRSPLRLSVLALVAACLIAHVSESQAAIYNWTSSSGSPARKLRLNIPSSVDSGVVRGIIIHGNGAGGDETSQAENAELVAFAESIGFAVLATGFWGKFDMGSGGTSSEFNTFVNRIVSFATESGHPELVNAPWIAEGFSNGGQMAYGLNVLAPERVIAFVANKGGYYNDSTPSLASLATPGILIAGETDTNSRRNAIEGLFNNNRPLGALWAWVEEENTSHQIGNSYKLIRPFLAECVRLRYPTSAGSPADGPVTLLSLDEEDGWIVNQNTWESGLTDVHAYEEETGDPFDFGWVPNQRIAYLYRAFSTYNKAAGAVSGSSTVVSGTLPLNLTFSVNMAGQSWSKIEFYEGETLLGEALPSGGSNPSVAHSVAHGGYYVFHGLVTKTDTSKSATLLLPVFVDGPLPLEEDPELEPALKVLVDFGSSGTTTIGSDDPDNTWNNFTSNTVNSSLSLVDSAGASTGITLTLTDQFTGNQSTGSTSPGVYVEQATRDSFYFDYGKTPQLTLTGLDPEKIYNLTFFGSRMTTSDSLIRSVRFEAQGYGSAVEVVNNATNNTSTVAEVTNILPGSSGEIVIDLEKNTAAPDVNNTTSGVGYLGAFELTTMPEP